MPTAVSGRGGQPLGDRRFTPAAATVKVTAPNRTGEFVYARATGHEVALVPTMFRVPLTSGWERYGAGHRLAVGGHIVAAFPARRAP
ncbi:hypothetical protein Afil01_22860 [Actinorhabdospora filicis]|uniref:Uncharacterized protein n=1 Tax=Actinorhabdospora filicis TaxID=1785913 RepID=A0A9W6W8D3_9ACTN|nr:hypothetical protein Afil01_22860 [Actinorhabdospora filicis]